MNLPMRRGGIPTFGMPPVHLIILLLCEMDSSLLKMN
jgi:hypothetical protein